MRGRAYELAAWVGCACVLTAFVLLTFGMIQPHEAPYLGLNAVGSLGILAGTIHKRDFPPAVLNAVWLLVAAYGLIRFVL